MYSKALFPESRGDILGLLEAMDKVPNQAEKALLVMLTQYIVLEEIGAVKLPDHLSYEEGATLPCAALTASKATEAGSAPDWFDTSSTPARSAQTRSCSTAAARKVSPAAQALTG